MVALSSLWISIVLAAVLVFIASALIWTALPNHKRDWKKLPNEDAVMDALRTNSVSSGSYFFPSHLGVDVKSAEYKERMQRGPAGILTIFDPAAGMGSRMVISLLFYLVVSFFVAYLASRTLSAGTDYLEVFRVAGTAAFMAYAFGRVPDAIWFGKPWPVVAKDMFDALVFALLTAGSFAGFWPD